LLDPAFFKLNAVSSSNDSSTIAEAVATWQAGQLVAFPTETVYGLGADALNPQALARIFALKQRPVSHPLIVHVADRAQLTALGVELSVQATRLADAFWPGPLTLILPKPTRLPDAVSGGRPTVGIRIPAHPVAQALLQAFGGPIAAPSANRFGGISATRFEHVRQSFPVSQLPCVVDGGPCEVGLESTIIDLSQLGQLTLLRPGHVTVAQMEAVIGHSVVQPQLAIAAHQTEQAPASGTLHSHYAPKTPLFLIPSDQWLRQIDELSHRLPRIACWGQSAPNPNWPDTVVYYSAPAQPEAYAAELYHTLHQLDRCQARVILVEYPLDRWEADGHTHQGMAIQDRLTRAAAGSPPLSSL
jgi:L-threonylcarbamoyladenylate synthase